MRKVGLALVAVFTVASLGLGTAEAKRVGGGKNVGKQAPNSVMQRDASPTAPSGAPGAAGTPGSAAAPGGPGAASSATPAAPAAGATAARPAAAPTAAAPQRNRWLAPIAGLAAGLGLAALASHLGFGEELASFMLMALLAVAILVVVRMVLSRRAAARSPEPAYAGGYRYTGLGQEASVPNWQAPPVPAASREQPIDAVAAPAEPVVSAGALPAGFDAEGFVRNAKVYFIRLQAAFDAGDTDDLREFTSPEMFAELKMEIDERAGAPNQTDVIELDGRILGVETGATEQIASVRFSGRLREQPDAGAEPFDEIWNFSRPVEGKGGWVLAGIQQLQRA